MYDGGNCIGSIKNNVKEILVIKVNQGICILYCRDIIFNVSIKSINLFSKRRTKLTSVIIILVELFKTF